MTTDQLTSLVNARPFVPFTIRTADGRQIQVTHPETITYRGGRIVVIFKNPDAAEIIDLLLVPSLEVGVAG
ncbi:MAG TPA: hypothetical protein VGH33_28715 [Isosphaeraceae bacterium]|jgi:hypothetical protein